MSDRPTHEELIEVRRQFKLPHEALVEKDRLVVRALAAIAAADKGPFQLVFQGATALSRAHRLIERTSEDIDIKIISEGPPPRPALRRLRESITGELHKAGFSLHAVSAALRADRGRAGDLAAGDSNRNLGVADAPAAGRAAGYFLRCRGRMSPDAPQWP